MDYADALIAAPDLHEMLKKGMTHQQYAVCVSLLSNYPQMPYAMKCKFELTLAAKEIYADFYVIVRDLNTQPA